MLTHFTKHVIALTAILAWAATSRTLAQEASESAASPAAATAAAPQDPAPDAPPEKGPPLPFHTIEGYGGGAITPMAYLVNPGPEGTTIGKPAMALSYVGLGNKDLDALTFTETLFGRIELGYGADRLGLGSLPSAIRTATTVDVGHSEVWLHTWSVRALLLKENSPTFKELLGELGNPAITIGAHFKYNDGIADINNRLGGALSSIGYRSDSGEDYTFTATKTLAKAAFGRPLIATAGMRISDAANLGFLGFSDNYVASFEGNVAVLPWDKVLVAYEFRQKTSPYAEIPGLLGGEDDWHAIDVGLILNPHSTLVAGWGHFGNLANTEADSAWWLQLKYEF